MKKFNFACLLASLLSAPVVGADTPAKDTAPPVTQAPQPTDPPGQVRKQTSPPAPTFTPSEKVSADSAVSFPVDI